MTVEVLKKLRENISTMPIEPPWCENAEMLKKWIEGYEYCQYSALRFIDLAIKNDEPQL